MGLKFDWVNPNIGLTKETRIYRSSKRITDLASAQVIATLPETATTYTDPSPPLNTVSHYCLVFVLLDDSLVKCSSQPKGYFPNGTGPGPTELLIGDWDIGYFGALPVSSLYTADELRAAIGTASLPGQVVGITNAKMTTWYKFVFEGKIIFVPQGHLVTNVKWVDLYNKGLVYGVDGPGVVNVTTGITGPVNQRVVLTKGGNTYKVRTPKGLNKSTGPLYPTAVASDLVGSEWDSILSNSFLVGQQVFNNAGSGKLNTFTIANLTGTPYYWMSITQHTVNAAGNSWVRGDTGYVDSNTSSLTGAWMPFLELEFA